MACCRHLLPASHSIRVLLEFTASDTSHMNAAPHTINGAAKAAALRGSQHKSFVGSSHGCLLSSTSA
eukprot:scaffold103675_cov70-Phaeocystis_antarctica.AAC.8